MKISIQRINESFHLEAYNQTGNIASFDASENIGGLNMGFRPMEMVLASLASCSSIDVIAILKKQKLNPRIFKVDVSAERADAIPAVFTKIYLKFICSNDVSEERLQRAVELSITKYCSVSKMLEKSVEIVYSSEIIK